jgi:hypothetical protein
MSDAFRRDKMASMWVLGEMSRTSTRIRKPYEKPAATKLTAEQAKLKLLGYASLGDQGAKDLLEMMFPAASFAKDSGAKKKSA